MKKGDRVKMRKAFKERSKAAGSAEHIEEFGECEGIVQGLADFGTQKGPDVDVRWQPSNLRYAYDPKDLVKVRGSKRK